MADEELERSSAMPAHGEFCWSEIASSKIDECRRFYSEVFGWKFNKSVGAGTEMEYLEFSSSGGGAPDAALYEMKPEMFGGQMPHPHIAQYVSVDDVDSSAELAVELGGSIVFGPYDIPNVGRMAVINDPTGAVISLITLARQF